MSAQQNNKEDPPVFEGFIPPTKNFFHMPNVWIDICAGIDNLAELKVVQYVLRHTWGYKEYDSTPKPITTDEFMHGRKRGDGTRLDKGTGLSKQSVIDGARRAVKHEYLICDVDDADKARISKAYALKMRIAESDVKSLDSESDVNDLDTENGCQETRHQLSKTLTPDVNEVDSRGLNSRQRSEKDTTRNTPKKDTEEKQGIRSAGESENATIGAIAPTPALVSHPEHHFLWFDDGVVPTFMVIRLTPEFPHPHFSEFEDKRRMHVAAFEVQPHLRDRGLPVTCRIEHETGDEKTLESTSYQPERHEHLVSASQATSQHPIANDTPEDTHGQNTTHRPGPAHSADSDPERREPAQGRAPAQAVPTAQSEAQGELNGHHHSGNNHLPEQRGNAVSASQVDAQSAQNQHPDVGTHGQDRGHTTPAAVASGDARVGGYTQATLTGAEKPVSARVEQVDIKKLSLQSHTDHVFRWLDEIKKEAKRDIRANYVKNPASEKLIKALITACWNTDKELTRENVRKAWRQMWNSKPGKDGFTWKKAGISIKAFTENYGEYLEKAWDEEPRVQEPTPTPVPTAATPTVSGLKRWVPPSQAQPAFAQ